MKSSMNFGDWMGQLDPKLKDISICYLAIPGSHDSLSFSVSRQSKLSPDAPRMAKLFYKICSPLMRRIAYNWCVTQTADLKRQFLSGIRYFDIRVATNESKIYSCHALYGMEIINALRILNEMLEVHSQEVIILDFQHFYEMKHSDHLFLIEKIHRIFGSKLRCFPKHVSELTLNELQAHQQQVIVVYRHKWAKAVPDFWPSWKWPTPWPNTTDIVRLRDFLTQTLPKRPQNAGFVSQCVFTPSATFITCHLFSTLRSTCAVPCDFKMKSIWIEDQKCLVPKGVNVIIADFIDLAGLDFCSTVINLNRKSLSCIM